VSLIADALDAAQRERAKRTGVRQAVLPESPSSFRTAARRARPALPREVAIALAGFAAVIVIAAAVSIMTAGSRAEVRPITSPNVAPPIPLPVQAPTDSSPLAAQTPATNPDTVLSSGFDAYDRAIQEYEQAPPRRTTFGRSDDFGQSNIDELAPPEPKPVPKGIFKITMQSAAPVVSTDRMFQQGLAAQQRGDLNAARDFYIQSIAEKPGSAETLNNLGAVYHSLGDNKRAEESYRRALDADPKFAAAWSNLAVVLDAQGKRQEATAALQESLRLDPRNVSTKVNLAIQFSALGLYPDARRLLEEAIRDNATLAEAHYTLGQVLEKQGERQLALNEYRTFLATSKGRFPRQEIQVRQHLKDLGGNAGN
jgi:Tfp pilus assembly protein PilF